MTPVKRENGLVIEPAGDETLVYDQRTHAAHCLDATATAVWDACDGSSDPADIAERTGCTIETVHRTLAELHHLDLLAPPEGQTRRNALRTIATAAIALPTVTSILAPTAAQASTLRSSGEPCTDSVQCDSGLCNAGVCY